MRLWRFMGGFAQYIYKITYKHKVICFGLRNSIVEVQNLEDNLEHFGKISICLHEWCYMWHKFGARNGAPIHPYLRDDFHSFCSTCGKLSSWVFGISKKHGLELVRVIGYAWVVETTNFKSLVEELFFNRLWKAQWGWDCRLSTTKSWITYGSGIAPASLARVQEGLSFPASTKFWIVFWPLLDFVVGRNGTYLAWELKFNKLLDMDDDPTLPWTATKLKPLFLACCQIWRAWF